MITEADKIAAKGLGVALGPDEETIVKLCQLSDELREWRGAFFQMRRSRDKWRRRWVIAFGALMLMIGGVAGFVLWGMWPWSS